MLCCGRRWGKDILSLDLLIRAACAGKSTAWIAPAYPQLVEVWRTLVDTLQPATHRKSEQEHQLRIAGGGIIDMWSLESIDTMRGRAYDLVIVNEAAHSPYLLNAWEQVIRPTLTDRSGGAWFPSTPKGFNAYHTLYQRGQDPQQPDWMSWQYPTSSNPYISSTEIEAARIELPDKVFRQEYLADFVASGGCLFEIDRIVEYQESCKPPLETRLNGALKIWQRPIPGRRYVAGADVAEGKDAGNDSMDYSGVAIYDWQTCVHVADLHGQWPVDVFAEKAAELSIEYNKALLGVERNNHGHAVLLALKIAGYPAIYQHDERNELDMRQGTRRLVAGWPTTPRTKPILEQDLAAAITSGSICSYDKSFWDECLSYVQHGNGTTGAQDGCHDDRVIKHMIALQMRKQVQPGTGSVIRGQVRIG